MRGTPPATTPLRRAAAVVAVAVLCLLAGACRTDVTVAVRADGSGAGEVRVEVLLDREVAERVDLRAELRTEDLVQAGWRVEGPSPAAEGRTRVAATKRFADPEELRRVLEEVGGEGGILRDFSLRRTQGLVTSRLELAGTVDLGAGIEAFGDDTVRRVLGGSAVGVDPAELDRALGRPAAEAVGFRFEADLPGRVETNAEGPAWTVALGHAVPVRATARALDGRRLAVGASAAALALLAGLVVLLRRGRRPTAPAARAAGGRRRRRTGG